MGKETELDKIFEYKPDPEVTKVHAQYFFGGALVGALCAIGIILAVCNADRIDAFANQKPYIPLIVLSVAGVAWLVWRIKKLME